MAITSLDGAIAGAQWPRFITKATASVILTAGKPFSLWTAAGSPGAGAVDTATSGGVALSSTSAEVNGQIPFTDPVSGNSYLSRFQGLAPQSGVLVLADRLWQCGYQTSTNGVISATVTTAQVINSTAFPARDNNASVNGEGVLIGVEINVATTTNAPTLTMSYTNSAATAGRTATNAVSTIAANPIGSFYPMGLQAGDKGVKSVESITVGTTWAAGSLNLVAYRPIVALELVGAYVPTAVDAITSGFPRLFNGTVPFLIFYPSTTTAAGVSNFAGQVVWTQG